MQKFRFENHFYNGHISPYAISYYATEYTVLNHQIYVTIECEFFNAEDGTPKREKLVGTALLSDLIFEYDYEEFLFELYDIANDFEIMYNKDFYIDKVPHCLSPKIFVCNDKTYTLGNIHIKDKNYESLSTTIEQQASIINLPLKLLKSVLSSPPFKEEI